MTFDDRPCELGEGPLWHPERKQLIWFDILGNRMLSRAGDTPLEWRFAERVSAAGWVDGTTLLVASETALSRFDIETGAATALVSLEADNATTRSNDGRADPQGGFWIGTMGKRAEKGAGAIWRYYRGELRRLYSGITISNAICFPPGGRSAHFTDTVTGEVMRVALDAEGWPKAAPEVFLPREEGRNPDGAVIDAAGRMWLAEWGRGRVACYGPDGGFLRAVEVPAPHASCPAFGGDTLYVTTALEGMSATERVASPQAGMVFAIPGVAMGQKEHRVIL